MAEAPTSHSIAKMEMPNVAKIFDIDQHTGFMASEPPLVRLPQVWEAWEIVLDAALDCKLQVGDKLGLTNEERAISKQWRERVQAVRIMLNKRNTLIPNFWLIVTCVIRC